MAKTRDMIRSLSTDAIGVFRQNKETLRISRAKRTSEQIRQDRFARVERLFNTIGTFSST